MMTLTTVEEIRASMLLQQEEEAMARVRGRQKGFLRREGPSWFLTYRRYRGDGEDTRETTWIGPASLTLKQAEAKARPIVDAANRAVENPSSTMLVADFIERAFRPHIERTKKHAGKKHYRYLLDTFILPSALGQMAIGDVRMKDVQALLDRAGKKYSRQTQLHIKNAVSAIFRLAIKQELYERTNPASLCEVGEVVAQKRPTYSVEQLAAVLVRLPSPIYEMALLATECSLGPAELKGVRIRHCNLTDEPMLLDGDVIAPHAIAISENVYEGHRGTLKTKARRRVVPLSPETSARLRTVIAAAKEPDAPLFQSSRGTSVDTHNIANRLFKQLTEQLKFPVSWYAFRRSHSSLAALTGANVQDRKLVMGHAKDSMSLYYDVQDVERMRGLTSRIAGAVAAAEEKARAEGKLVQMERKAG